MGKRLFDALTDYAGEDVLPMHMPGHKRNPIFGMKNPYELDITEIRGFDDLHHPQGMILDLMNRISERYGSEQSYVLVNGSTAGILAAITACCRRGDRIAVARNCHKSVYNAMRLLGLRPVYLMPDGPGGDLVRLGIAGSIRPETVEAVLKANPDISCVVITSPTYEGIVSPIRDIADTVHRFGRPLVVDEAHGAHFEWHSAFPESAVRQGADLVVESLHKTLPAFTQTAVLHAAFPIVEREAVEWALQTYQSSSPSYILMAGIDYGIRFLEDEGAVFFHKYIENRMAFGRRMNTLKYLSLFEPPEKELSKVVIATDRAGVSGRELADILYKGYRIELELSCGSYCVALTSLADSEEAFLRLGDALLAIDGKLPETAGTVTGIDADLKKMYRTVLCPGEQDAFCDEPFIPWNCARESIPIGQAAGRRAADHIYLYPPGVPLIAAGERITKEHIQFLEAAEAAGYEVHGEEQGIVSVVPEERKGGL